MIVEPQEQVILVIPSFNELKEWGDWDKKCSQQHLKIF